MELTKQVVSLELAQKLKSLGVKQESLFYWYKYKPVKSDPFILIGNDNFGVTSGGACMNGSMWTDECYAWCSAFTVAELGELLPDEMFDEHEDIAYNLSCVKTDSATQYWTVMYIEYDRGALISFEADTEADARAKCLIYLLEQGIIKA